MIATITAAALGAAAGTLTPDVPAIGVPTADAPRRLTGHLYYNATTGESVFTPAKEYLANRAQMPLRALGDDINADGYPDLWINTNTDPCPIGTPTEPYLPLGIIEGGDKVYGDGAYASDHHLYKSQLHPGVTDLRVETITLSFWTDLDDTDTNLDTIPDGNTAGAGIDLTFWDREDFHGVSSCFCTEAGGPGLTRTHLTSLALTNLPGTLTPGELAGTIITIELAPSQVFEIGDSDGVGPSSGLYNPMIAAFAIDYDGDTVPEVRLADTDYNGTVDWSHSFTAILPTDGRQPSIGYQLAAPGRFGAAGLLETDGVTPLNPQAGISGDGLIDLINRTDGTPPLQWSHTRVTLQSLEPPMGRGFPFTSVAVGTAPEQLSQLSRYSNFVGAWGDDPDPHAGPHPTLPFLCAGIPNSDYFGWGATHPPDGTFYGDLNCEIDDDGDTVPDGRPISAAFLALSAAGPCTTFADCDDNAMINIDDIDCFVAGFLASDVAVADCDANGILTIDDIDCFISSFLAGCP